MKLRNLLFLALPLFALSITSCGKGNNEDDNGGGGGGGVGGSSAKAKSAIEKEAYDYFKALTGREPERWEYSDDEYDLGKSSVSINFQKKYKSHEELLKAAMAKLDTTKYDLSEYTSKGFGCFSDVSGTVYADSYAHGFNTKHNDETYTGPRGEAFVQSICVATEQDQKSLRHSSISNKGEVTYYPPDIGDYFLKVSFRIYK